MRFARSATVPLDLHRVNTLTEAVIGAAIKVHKALVLKIRANVPVPVMYDEVRLELGFRLDVVVEDYLVLEIKSVKKLAPIHDAQVLTYLKLSGFPIALLMNFNVTLLKNGVKRRINPHPAERFLDGVRDPLDQPRKDLR